MSHSCQQPHVHYSANQHFEPREADEDVVGCPTIVGVEESVEDDDGLLLTLLGPE